MEISCSSPTIAPRWTRAVYVSNVSRTPSQRKLIAAHNQRWSQRHLLLISVEDVAAALERISREHPDAPRPIERTRIVSFLAQVYANGNGFTDNSPRSCEAVRAELISCLYLKFFFCAAAKVAFPSQPRFNTETTLLSVIGGAQQNYHWCGVQSTRSLALRRKRSPISPTARPKLIRCRHSLTSSE